MKKKITAVLIIVFILTIQLTACGSASIANSGSSDTAANQAEVNQTAEVLANAANTVSESSNTAVENTTSGNITQSTVTKENAKWKIGVTITDLTVPVWADYANALVKYGNQAGMYVNVVSPEGDAEKQISEMENFVTDGYNVIVVSAADNESMGVEAKKVTDQGVVVFSQGYEFDNYTAAMLEEKQVFGHHTAQMAAKWINEKFQDGKCKVIVAGNQKVPLMQERTNGIYAGLKEYAPNAEVVATVYGSNEEEFLPEMENALTAHPDVKVVVSYSSGGALAAREAVKGQGLAADDFGIFCTDCDDGVADALYQNDLIRGALSMGGGDYMAKSVVETLVKILNKQSYDKVINFPQVEVYPEDVLQQADQLGYKVKSANE